MINATSLTYDFPNTFTFRKCVDLAFQRIGIDREAITEQHIELCTQWANLELHQWSARHTALCWTERNIFTFIPGQIFYKLPSYIYKVEAAVRTYCVPQTIENTTLTGTPFASEGNAVPCFTPTSTSGLTQTSPGGYIGFSFNSANNIWYVGINTLFKRDYTIAIEYSYDNVNWEVAKQSPTFTYYPGLTTWWVVEWPPQVKYWRIREVKNATLAIQQISFCKPTNPSNDIPIGTLDRSDFLNYAQKINLTSTPTAYYFNEKIDRTVYIYGNSYLPNEAFLYTAQIYPQDISHLFQKVDVDVKFYLSLVAALSYHAAINYAPDKVNIIKPAYDEIYKTMKDDDGERVPLKISIDLSQNWVNV